MRRRCGGAASIAALAATLACPYGFAGGGLPPHVRTVAILPFDNLTPEPALTQEVSVAVRTALEDRLGLRVAGEATADAVVRGRIVRYEPAVPVAFRPGEGDVEVTQRQVEIAVDVEIVDQQEGKTLWSRRGLVAQGEYAPPAELNGRRLALEKLVNAIVEGAQSQW
ncbi:MAG: LPS assembly lipoprotein LptE [Gammaproteobacteria bacterium]